MLQRFLVFYVYLFFKEMLMLSMSMFDQKYSKNRYCYSQLNLTTNIIK